MSTQGAPTPQLVEVHFSKYLDISDDAGALSCDFSTL